MSARNLKGVTIKDALDAIYKQFKKKVCLVLSSIFIPSSLFFSFRSSFAVCGCGERERERYEHMLMEGNEQQTDDEMELPVLAGFEWDKDECYTRFVVHQKKEGAASNVSRKAAKKASKAEDAGGDE